VYYIVSFSKQERRYKTEWEFKNKNLTTWP